MLGLGREAGLGPVATQPGPWAGGSLAAGWVGLEVCGSRKVFDQNLEQRLSLTVLETRREGAMMAEWMKRAVREVTAYRTPLLGFFQGSVVKSMGSGAMQPAFNPGSDTY